MALERGGPTIGDLPGPPVSALEIFDRVGIEAVFIVIPLVVWEIGLTFVISLQFREREDGLNGQGAEGRHRRLILGDMEILDAHLPLFRYNAEQTQQSLTSCGLPGRIRTKERSEATVDLNVL
ncbi:hypothetical protein O1W68_21505 [Rhodococcus sp. H36-A4]|nr:hypothetical protein [Rhodococcus sp. H36-A4]MCZ4080518.1 hypothetical protein [Rhodococcus sp. H36-A4]